jgi:hypothetical protein
MWLTYLSVNTSARTLRFDLAADVSGRGRPSAYWAGLARPAPPSRPSPAPPATGPLPESRSESPVGEDPVPGPVVEARRAAAAGEPLWPEAALALLLTAAAATRVAVEWRRRG